jgi:hypothetical protein
LFFGHRFDLEHSAGNFLFYRDTLFHLEEAPMESAKSAHRRYSSRSFNSLIISSRNFCSHFVQRFNRLGYVEAEDKSVAD